MGTNYYVVKNRPTVADPIHIGKSSAGWRFLFHQVNEPWNEPPVHWNSWEQVMDWLKKYTVDSKECVIIDEYDQIISFDDFCELVEDKQKIENPEQFDYCSNIRGYRFVNREFC